MTLPAPADTVTAHRWVTRGVLRPDHRTTGTRRRYLWATTDHHDATIARRWLALVADDPRGAQRAYRDLVAVLDLWRTAGRPTHLYPATLDGRPTLLHPAALPDLLAAGHVVVTVPPTMTVGDTHE